MSTEYDALTAAPAETVETVVEVIEEVPVVVETAPVETVIVEVEPVVETEPVTELETETETEQVDPEDDESLTEVQKLEAKIQHWKTMSRMHERATQTLKKAHEKEKAELAHTTLVSNIVKENNLPSGLEEFLTATTEDGLKAQAQKLLGFSKAPAPVKETKTVFNPLQGGTTELNNSTTMGDMLTAGL